MGLMRPRLGLDDFEIVTTLSYAIPPPRVRGFIGWYGLVLFFFSLVFACGDIPLTACQVIWHLCGIMIYGKATCMIRKIPSIITLYDTSRESGGGVGSVCPESSPDETGRQVGWGILEGHGREEKGRTSRRYRQYRVRRL